ncbi:hypothetical protein I552_9745, partial [Mycobacterium xenopi 3993]
MGWSARNVTPLMMAMTMPMIPSTGFRTGHRSARQSSTG